MEVLTNVIKKEAFLKNVRSIMDTLFVIITNINILLLEYYSIISSKNVKI